MAKVEDTTFSSDPVVTANVYCKDRIDAVLLNGLGPFQREFLLPHSDRWGMWTMRYRRCGEHLKVRVHCGPESVSLVKDALSQFLSRALKGMTWPALSGNGKVTGALDPAIDQEDQASGDYAPGTVLFTKYNRSHVTFGGSPYLEDQHYAGLFSGVLIAACRYILNHAPTDQTGLGHATRARLLADLLEAAREELQLENPANYFEYHRDWLVRFVLFKTSHTPEEQNRVVDVFDNRLEGPSGAFWTQLASRSRDAAAADPEGLLEWKAAVKKLMAYTFTLCEDQKYQIDPFARHPSHSVLFKALHGASNQLGLALLDEALVHHALQHDLKHSVSALALQAD